MSERFVQLIINSLPVSNTIALDIGTAEGIYVPSLAGKFSEVYAFDADKSKAPGFMETFCYMKNVHLVNKAVSDKSEKRLLYKSTLNPGRHTINEQHYKDCYYTWGYWNGTAEEVDAITIDDFCKDKKVGFIKCDIEGGEVYAFKAANETLKNNQMDVVIEIHEGIEITDIDNNFKELGYKKYAEQEPSIDGMIHFLWSNRSFWEDLTKGHTL